MTRPTSPPTADVVVVGDGIAGSALAQALRRRGVDVVLVGPDEAWHATYGTWADDVEAIEFLSGVSLWEHRMESIDVRFERPRTIDRPYGVVDNAAVRRALREGVHHERMVVRSSDEVDARLVIDATGWPSRIDAPRPGMSGGGTAWQTAYGVVLPEPPSGFLGAAVLMDYSQPPLTSVEPDRMPPSFAYALPVRDGWLVEETVLAALPAVDPVRLVGRLAARLDVPADELDALATRTESVHIPMGAPAPPRSSRPTVASNVVRFGASAGMIHPATGYSVSTSLRAADLVGDAITHALSGTDHRLVDLARAAIWPPSSRRTRVLHEYGLHVLIGADGDELRSFFDAFFDLPPEQWAAYLRIDTPPLAMASVMAAMFRRADRRLRRRLLSSNPLAFVHLIRP